MKRAIREKQKRVVREEPIKRYVRKLIVDSRNRMYRNDLLEKEINEMMELLLVRCEQLKKDPLKILLLIDNQIKELPNLAFCVALHWVLGLDYRTVNCYWRIDGWKPKVKRAKRY